MAPLSLKVLIATALALANVHAGPCKPLLGSSSIISFSSTFSSTETHSIIQSLSTTEEMSPIETQTTTHEESTTESLTTIEVQSTTESHSTTETLSTTIFESTTSTETTTAAAAATTTREACTPMCGGSVSKKSGVCEMGTQIAPWKIDDSWHIGTYTLNGAACADACANDCHCKSFTIDSTTCDLYSGSQAQINPVYFYLGPYFYDMATCYECDD
ncbi:hypothetical protein FBEOM_1458 [Fusarium beomiforme]|uniref:Apple domain-containing protein n=1 Tax=Fusarium beomiforme TaxID=44412 RepID=A0A9P5E358_9HYPO|nr:hypothetical protein FBEOM_1458 [Fusarium beomiforme]